MSLKCHAPKAQPQPDSLCSTHPPTGGTAAAGGAAAGEEEGEEEGPQKFESEIVANEDAGKVHYKSKSKMMHFKKNDNGKSAWDTKGVGLVQLRTRKEDPTKPFVTFTTESVGGACGLPLGACMPMLCAHVDGHTQGV